MRALIVGLGSIGRRHARNWAALGLGPVVVCRQTDSPQPEPLGVDAREFTDLDQALAERPDVVLGKLLVVGYNLRFHPGLARFRQLVQGGAVGKPISARAEAGEYLPDWHPWEDYRASYSGRRDLGGGVLLTFSHEIDSLCWILGAPASVMAMAVHASSLEIDTEDVAELVLQFPNGPLASVHVDYLRRPARRSIEIVGEEGVLRWEYEENRVLRYAPATRQWRVEEGDRRFQRNDMYLAELQHLAACVRGEVESPRVDGQQAAAILAIARAAQQSSVAGRAIDLRAEGEPVTTWLSSLGRP
ncbi:MAG: Gfo/Idh/MocA family oxidoreductase [Chloroflexi bacterium]|nr:Gfo/Idh/MocA family oxidoreductase [Chloroflexota bacterium]